MAGLVLQIQEENIGNLVLINTVRKSEDRDWLKLVLDIKNKGEKYD